MATSFGHNVSHQAIEQKLKQAGTYSANSSIYMTILHYMYQPVQVFVQWPDERRYGRN
jgi:hypothetical protein